METCSKDNLKLFCNPKESVQREPAVAPYQKQLHQYYLRLADPSANHGLNLLCPELISLLDSKEEGREEKFVKIVLSSLDRKSHPLRNGRG